MTDKFIFEEALDLDYQTVEKYYKEYEETWVKTMKDNKLWDLFKVGKIQIKFNTVMVFWEKNGMELIGKKCPNQNHCP